MDLIWFRDQFPDFILKLQRLQSLFIFLIKIKHFSDLLLLESEDFFELANNRKVCEILSLLKLGRDQYHLSIEILTEGN